MELRSNWILKKRQSSFRNMTHHWCVYMDRSIPLVKKNGKPFKNSKPREELLFSVPSKEVGEHICILHNVQLSGDEVMKSFVDEKINQHRTELLELLALTDKAGE